MAIVLINEIFDENYFKQVEKAQQEIGKIVQMYEQLNKAGSKPMAGGTTKQVIDENQKLVALNEKVAAGITNVQKETIKLNQIKQEQLATAKAEIQATNEQLSAYKRLEGEARKATAAFRDLAATKGLDNKETIEAGKRAGELNQKLKDIDATVNQHQRNVGNYEGAVVGLRTQIRSLTQTLGQMELQGKNNSTEYKQMVMQLGKLKDAMGDVSARSKFFADDQRYVTGMTQAIQGMIGAYSAYVAVVGLVAGEDEELAKNMQKLMQLMVLMQGITQVSTALNKDSAAMVMFQVAGDKLKALFTRKAAEATVIATAATEADTAATEANTVAKTSSKGVIGIVIALIAAAGIAMYKYVKSLYDVSEAENRVIENQKKAVEGYSTKVAEIELYVGVLKTETATEKEKLKALKDLDEAMGTNLTSYKDKNQAMSLAIGLSDLYIIKLKKEAEAEAAKELYTEAFKTKLLAEKSTIQDNIKWYDYLLEAMGVFSDGQFQAGEEGDKRRKEVINETNKDIDAFKNMYEGAARESAAATEQFLAAYKKLGIGTKEVKDHHDQLSQSLDRIIQKAVNLKDAFVEVSKMETIESETVLPGLLKKQEQLTNEFLRFNKTIEKTGYLSEGLVEKLNFASGVLGSINNIIGDINDLYSQKADNQIKESDRAKNAELKNLEELHNAQIISDSEYASRKNMIDEEYDRKKNEIAKREFERSKKLKMIQAGMDLAMAQIGIWATVSQSNFWTVLAESAAIGALFTINFEKLRQSQYSGYAKGRKDGPGERAWLGEEGWELTGDKSGRIWKTPDHATLSDLKPGQWVLPHDRSVILEKMFTSNNIVSDLAPGKDIQSAMILGELKKLNNKSTIEIHNDRNGATIYLQQMISKKKFLDNMIRFQA